MAQKPADRNKRIVKVNRILVKRYGIPERQNPLPVPIDLLIATILSQNTNDNNSFRAYQNLRAEFKTWNEILNVKQSRIEKLISVAGLTLQKASAIKNLITGLYSERGEVSVDYLSEMKEEEAIIELTRFKGVGVKTASCVLLFALDRNVCPVDTHVNRIVNRLGLAESISPEKTYFQLNNNFPAKIAHPFHTNLIKLGREICKPQNPACNVCPLEKLCIFDRKNFEITRSIKRKDFMLLDNIKD